METTKTSSLEGSEVKEKLEGGLEALLTEAHEFGNGYKSMLDAIKDGGAFEAPAVDGEVREFLGSLHKAVEAGCAAQQKIAEAESLIPWDIVARTVKAKGIELDKETSQVSTAFPNARIPILKVDAPTYNRIEPGSRALSVKPKAWVSYVLLRDMPNQPDLAAQAMEEDVPHEIHHVVYNFADQAGALKNNETEPAMAEGFNVFRDELCARLCSEGPLSGYTQLNGASKSKLESIGQEKAQALRAQTVELNTILEMLEANLRGSSIEKADLLLPVLQSGSFQDLKDFCADITELTGRNKKEEPAFESGWGFA